MRRLRVVLAVVVWIALLLGMFMQVTERLASSTAARQAMVPPPPLSQLSTSVLNTLTLGYRGLYDDFADIWLLQALGDKDIKSFDPRELIKTIRTVTRHGPKLESLYLLSCFVLAFEFKIPEECQAIIVDGMNAMPGSWRIPMTQGYITAFVLNDPATGALYYELAGSRPGAPAYFTSLATKLAARSAIDSNERAAIKRSFFESIGIDRGIRPDLEVPQVEEGERQQPASTMPAEAEHAN
ncbi:MAG: hypothetical protein FJ146_14690 [Deltaproteobacteria bacterium]|nr:hypothetical protein [Deltaproteobacteria bacterium]